MRERGQASSIPPKQLAFYRDTIETLKGETQKLKEQMNSEALNVKGIPGESSLARLQDQGEFYSKKIDCARQRKSELRRRTQELQGRIQGKREEKLAMNHSEWTAAMFISQTKKLENQIDKANQVFNRTFIDNRQMREEIDHIRREKLISLAAKKEIEEHFKRQKAEHQAVVQLHRATKEERQVTRKKLSELYIKAERGREEFKRDWNGLNKLVAHDKKMKEFIEARVGKLQIEEKPEKEDHEILKAIDMATSTVKHDMKTIKHSVEKVEQFDYVFKNIEQETKITDIKQLVQEFVDTENKNYSYYNYFNELNAETEKLKMEIIELEEAKALKLNMKEPLGTQKLKIFKILERKIQIADENTLEQEKKYEESMNSINNLKLGLCEILGKIGTNNAATDEILAHEGVTERNMMHCLGIIELRTNEILQMYKWCQSEGPMNPSHPSNRKKLKEPFEYNLSVPEISDKDEDSEDHGAKICDKSEFKDYAKSKFKEILSNK